MSALGDLIQQLVQWGGSIAGAGGGVTAGWLAKTLREAVTNSREAIDKANGSAKAAAEALSVAREARDEVRRLEGRPSVTTPYHGTAIVPAREASAASIETWQAFQNFQAALQQRFDTEIRGLKFAFGQLQNELEQRIDRDIREEVRRSRPDPSEVETRGVEPGGRFVRERLQGLESRIDTLEDRVTTLTERMNAFDGELKRQSGARHALQETFSRFVERTNEWQANMQQQLGVLIGRLQK